MPRPKKEGTSMSFKLKNEIVEQLNQYSEKTMIPKTCVVELALKEFFEKCKTSEQ